MFRKEMPACRNGRRGRLKICCGQPRAGSSPAAGSIKTPNFCNHGVWCFSYTPFFYVYQLENMLYHIFLYFLPCITHPRKQFHLHIFQFIPYDFFMMYISFVFYLMFQCCPKINGNCTKLYFCCKTF